jgi:hypothetical protein
MASLAIVEDFNEFENVVPGFVAGLVLAMMHQLGFQCVEKALANSSSVANTISAQGAGEMDATATTKADGGRPSCD